MPYTPGDEISPLKQWFIFSLPQETWVQAVFLGQLEYLRHSPSFTSGEEVTPAQAAAAFDQITDSLVITNSLVGAIIPFGADNMEFIGQNPLNGPSNYLKCDGASYLTSDWPDLFAVIGYIWGGSGANFNVPDLQGRTAIGDGSGSGLTTRLIGNIGGQETHTLSTGEMPSHQHTESATTPFIADITTPTGIAATGVPGLTGFNGGGNPHNNMQPFSVVSYYIVAR